jgi:methyl-accepting chemotaxis protein
MNIDRILSRFRIQTKVLIFILPFVISITAVGVTGLYASGLLQGRMEISNSVLQSLSGFRDASAAMKEFLDNATAEKRDHLAQLLKTQGETLGATLSQLAPDAEGRAELESAQKSVGGIVARIGDLWALHEKETTLDKQIRSNLSVVTASQMMLGEQSTQLQKQMRGDESAAKTLLREADRINTSAKFLTDLSNAFMKAKTPEEKFEVVKSKLGELKKRLRILTTALPATNKAVAKSLSVALTELDAMVKAGDKSMDGVQKMSSKVSSFRQTSVYLGVASALKMKTATQKFSELDAPLIKAEGILSDSRKVVTSGYSIQIEMARFLEDPTEVNRKRLFGEFEIVRKDMDVLEKTAGDQAFFPDLKAKFLPAIDGMDRDSTELVKASDLRHQQFEAAAAEIDTIWQQLTSFAELQKRSAGQERENANGISISATVLGIVIAIFAGIGLVMTFKGPIGQITAAMRRLADGKLDTAIDGEARIDEIGEMARALGIFKQNAVAKIEIEQQSEAERTAAEAERRRNDAEKIDVDQQIDFAVNTLAAGLGRLSRGDISQMIETPFFGKLETLRNDFNSSLIKLQDTLSQIRDNAQMIQHNSNELSGSADELSKRTEQQAASLEQTAAAVEQITVTVKSSAERAQEANQIVAETKSAADASSKVVSSAIDAMSRIEDASGKIVQIIDVIDEIAFQTNLLALNAGIEAARAGDAGKGFAVVAQEVRELAQRSASAAKEIKDLIDKSTTEVTSGSRLVQQTGKVLSDISNKILTVSERVEMIAMASRDQSTGLAEVNASVNSMDHMTQKNAAMVEETTAATRQLANEADTMMTLVDQFKLSGGAMQAEAARRVA